MDAVKWHMKREKCVLGNDPIQHHLVRPGCYINIEKKPWAAGFCTDKESTVSQADHVIQGHRVIFTFILTHTDFSNTLSLYEHPLYLITEQQTKSCLWQSHEIQSHAS